MINKFAGPKIVEPVSLKIEAVEGGSYSVLKTQKNVAMPMLPEGSLWERNVLNSFE